MLERLWFSIIWIVNAALSAIYFCRNFLKDVMLNGISIEFQWIALYPTCYTVGYSSVIKIDKNESMADLMFLDSFGLVLQVRIQIQISVLLGFKPFLDYKIFLFRGYVNEVQTLRLVRVQIFSFIHFWFDCECGEKSMLYLLDYSNVCKDYRWSNRQIV